MRKKTILLFFVLFALSMEGREVPPPQIGIGGGYWQAGDQHSGGLFQLDCRLGNYCFWNVRPQLVAIFPECNAVFAGLGLGYELYFTRHFLIIPSFTPGLYFKGRGRDLGYPLEFRSSLEAVFTYCNCRLGGQIYHISNASLASRNPGGNAYVLYVAIPFPRSL